MIKDMNNRILLEDIQSVVKEEYINWRKFAGKTIAVTGATGLMGKMTILILLEANRTYHLELKVLAFVRNIEKAKLIYADYMSDALQFIVQDIMLPVSEEVYADYLIHGASVTASKMMVEMPVETITTAIIGTKNMMDFAVRCNMEGVVYLSSMEVYGTIEQGHGAIKEEYLGYINPLEIRSSYSEGKRMSECLCASYAKEYGVNVKIARLAQTFGAGIAKEENRVFAQFARACLKNENIVLHTNGEKANCYCYTTDAVSGILLLLTKGINGQAYNVANQDTFCSIREMAEQFIQVSENQTSRLVFDIPQDLSKYGYAPSSIMKLDSSRLMELGWMPRVDMENMVKRLMSYMQENES